MMFIKFMSLLVSRTEKPMGWKDYNLSSPWV